MNITKTNIDALNAVVTVELSQEDYAPQVEKVLKHYVKTASIPGFRKGAVPMSLVKKQYGKAILAEEVNKVLQDSLNKFMTEQKLNILGNPIPKVNEAFRWEDEIYKFEFELGLTPEFDVDLESLKNVTRYKVVADDKMLEDQILRIRKQYGKLIQKAEIAEGDDISGTFLNEEKGIDSPARFGLDVFKDKETALLFIGKKTGDTVTLNTKGLFPDDHQLMEYLKVSHDEVHGLDLNVDFKIEEINFSEPGELNQELFDKLFGEGNVASVEEVKARIRQDTEQHFEGQANQKFLSDVAEALMAQTKFELPSAFLKRWLQNTGEAPLTPEQAEQEWSKSENGLRYQLIEGRVVNQYDIQLTFDDLKSYTAEMIRRQMAQFGQLNPTEEDVDGIVARVLSNQEEIKRLSDQVMAEKMLNLYKDKVKATEKEVTYDQFVAATYGEH